MEVLGKKEGTEDTYRLKIRCGGGTYIRSLARDIAAALDTKAVMSALNRTQSGAFHLDNAVDFSVFEQDPDLETLQRYIIPTESVLPFARLEPIGRIDRIFNGLTADTNQADGWYKLYREEEFYGIAEVKDGKAKAKTKLC